MSDELEDVILKTVRDRNCNRTESYMRGLREEATAIAAAIRSRWPELGWPCRENAGPIVYHPNHDFKKTKDYEHEIIRCRNCGQPKPGPATGDERGADAEAIKMWSHNKAMESDDDN